MLCLSFPSGSLAFGGEYVEQSLKRTEVERRAAKRLAKRLKKEEEEEMAEEDDGSGKEGHSGLEMKRHPLRKENGEHESDVWKTSVPHHEVSWVLSRIVAFCGD